MCVFFTTKYFGPNFNLSIRTENRVNYIFPVFEQTKYLHNRYIYIQQHTTLYWYIILLLSHLPRVAHHILSKMYQITTGVLSIQTWGWVFRRTLSMKNPAPTACLVSKTPRPVPSSSKHRKQNRHQAPKNTRKTCVERPCVYVQYGFPCSVHNGGWVTHICPVHACMRPRIQIASFRS